MPTEILLVRIDSPRRRSLGNGPRSDAGFLLLATVLSDDLIETLMKTLRKVFFHSADEPGVVAFVELSLQLTDRCHAPHEHERLLPCPPG